MNALEPSEQKQITPSINFHLHLDCPDLLFQSYEVFNTFKIIFSEFIPLYLFSADKIPSIAKTTVTEIISWNLTQ